MVLRMYQLFYWELFRYFKKSTGSMAEAEDIVQEAFLKALENRELIDTMEENQCRAWLYRTAKNICIDRIRRTKAEPVQIEAEGRTDDLTRTEVMQLCRELEPEVRAIFMLRYFEGYNASEIGAMYRLPPGTVRSRLTAARKTMEQFYPELKKRRNRARNEKKSELPEKAEKRG